MAYKLVTDGASDLNIDFYKSSDIVMVPMDSTMETETFCLLSSDEEYLNTYYEYMLNDKAVSTSQVTQTRFEEYFKKVLEDGEDIIYTGLSSGLSGTYLSALKAKENLEKKFPERRITVIDSLTGSTGCGVLFSKLYELKNDGLDYDGMTKWITDNSKFVSAQFGVDDLKYLYKGGRVSKSTATVGNFLKVKPLLRIDYDGKLEILGINRGKKNTMKGLLKTFEETWDPEISKDVVIGYAYFKENAEMLQEMVEKSRPEAKVYLAPIGSLIGSHVGPGMYSLCYFAKKRWKKTLKF